MQTHTHEIIVKTAKKITASTLPAHIHWVQPVEIVSEKGHC